MLGDQLCGLTTAVKFAGAAIVTAGKTTVVLTQADVPNALVALTR